MPWCPACKTEYREGFLVCDDCKIDLVDALQSAAEQETKATSIDPWVFLAGTIDDTEAVIIEALLRSNGISLMKKHTGAGAVLKTYLVEMTNFSVDLFVPESQYAQAKELLNDIRGE